MRALITLTVSFLAATPAWAAGADLKPSQIFAADSPSIVVVVAYGQDGKAIAQGSGVVIAKDTVVSNCHVIEKADTASVLYRSKRFSATLRYMDVERDLCSFTVKGLSAPPVQMGYTSQVHVGDPAYAIGTPEGLSLTLSGGLISSLRKIPGGVVLQMTTPISPGSSGGGLFDSEGRLIGITSYYMKGGEQLNFALPVEWVRELPQRGNLASTKTSDVARAADVVQKSNLQAGLRAWVAGDYATALAILKPFAMQGNAAAQFSLGAMYLEGAGVPEDDARAARWFRKSAGQGLEGAQVILGAMYDDGQGVPQDYAQAVTWYRKAAAQGDADAEYSLGVLYANGRGVPQDYSQALAWYRRATAHGSAAAQVNLGVMYADGQGVPQDYARATALFREAAAQGDAAGAGALGEGYYLGLGVPQDYKQAVAWYSKAAAQGNASAQERLGRMYYMGYGVAQDYRQAVMLWRKAAAQGNAFAQGFLGAMYVEGQGVPQDYVAAYALLNLSASLDSSSHNPAAGIRRSLVASMTSVQVQAGQALTREMQRIGVIKALDEYLNGGTPKPSFGSSSGRRGGAVHFFGFSY